MSDIETWICPLNKDHKMIFFTWSHDLVRCYEEYPTFTYSEVMVNYVWSRKCIRERICLHIRVSYVMSGEMSAILLLRFAIIPMVSQ